MPPRQQRALLGGLWASHGTGRLGVFLQEAWILQRRGRGREREGEGGAAAVQPGREAMHAAPVAGHCLPGGAGSCT